jgi:hypothetical protein
MAHGLVRSASVALALSIALCTACGDPVGSGGTGGVGGSAVSTTAVATSSVASTSSVATAASSSTGAGGAIEPPFASLPWDTGPSVGFGVASKDSQNPLGSAVFVGYAGYGISLDEAEAWVTALYDASLRAHGVRWVFAVQGPADVSYAGLEIGNSKIAAALGAHVDGSTPFILVAAHSSGSFVAHELFSQLAGGLDPSGVTAGKVVYFDLDGGVSGLDATSAGRLRKAYFTSAFDASTATYSPNHASMLSGAASFGTYFDTDANAAGCQAGAIWCLHMTLVNERPHDPAGASGPLDYTDFAGRPVHHAYVEDHAAEAGITP